MILLDKPEVQRVRELPLNLDFTWCNGDAPRGKTAKLRDASEPEGCGHDLHAFVDNDHAFCVSIPEELAKKLCHGLHYVDILVDKCYVCDSKPIFLDYSCTTPACEVTVAPSCTSETKCNV